MNIRVRIEGYKDLILVNVSLDIHDIIIKTVIEWIETNLPVWAEIMYEDI